MDAPQASFTDDRIDMAYWYPKVAELDVPTPETYSVELFENGEGRPDWDTERAAHIVEKLGGEAFIRSGYKSAQMAMSGSHIPNTNHEAIDETIAELLSQHVMMSLPTGGNVWLRTNLDVNFCAYTRENLVPEVRVFIRDGDVVCHHPRLEGFDDHPEHKETAIDYIESAWEREYAEYEPEEHRKESLKTYAERVADEMDGWWSVDFIMDRDGDWWLTDMALDALYDASDRGKDEMRSISEHPGDCEHQIE